MKFIRCICQIKKWLLTLVTNLPYFWFEKMCGSWKCGLEEFDWETFKYECLGVKSRLTYWFGSELIFAFYQIQSVLATCIIMQVPLSSQHHNNVLIIVIIQISSTSIKFVWVHMCVFKLVIPLPTYISLVSHDVNYVFWIIPATIQILGNTDFPLILAKFWH